MFFLILALNYALCQIFNTGDVSQFGFPHIGLVGAFPAKLDIYTAAPCAEQTNRKTGITAHIKGIASFTSQLTRAHHKMLRRLGAFLMEFPINYHLKFRRFLFGIGGKVGCHALNLPGCFRYFIRVMLGDIEPQIILLGLPCRFQDRQAVNLVIHLHLFFHARVGSRKGLKLGVLQYGFIQILTGSKGGTAGHDLADIPLFLL